MITFVNAFTLSQNLSAIIVPKTPEL